ncbi:MAG TPA: GAF domain-containing protein [Tepidisphaeraceae bacterium]|nr:GAF domain-containing protein [Tepidisphaeraceae bacterium]
MSDRNDPTAPDVRRDLPPARRAPLTDGAAFRALLSLACLLTVGGAVGLLWATEVERGEARAALDRVGEAKRLAARAEALVDAEVGRARALVAEIAKGEKWDQGKFTAAVERLLKPSRAFAAAGWLQRPTGAGAPSWPPSTPQPVTYAYPTGTGGAKDDQIAKGADLRAGDWGFAVWKASTERLPRVAWLGSKGARVELWLVLPAVSGEGESRGYLGSLVVRFDVGAVLRDLGPPGTTDPSRYDVRIEERFGTVYARGRAIADGDADGIEHQPVRVVNRVCRLSLRAGPGLAAPASAAWVLWAGLPVAVGVSAGMWVALRRRARFDDEARWQLDALEELTRAAGAVSTDLAEGGGALDQLAGSARRLLHMKQAAISLVDLDAGTIELVGRDGLERDRRVLFDAAEGSGTRACFATGQPLISEDVRTDPRVNAKVLADLYGVVSVIMVPLMVGGKPVGVMYLGNDAPRTYTETEVRLATVLGAQAGVFLAILRLLRANRAALDEQRALAAQHEALYGIAGEIYRTEDLGESLKRLADAAPSVIGVDLCMVSLRTGRGAESQVYAVTNNEGGVTGERHDLTGTHAEEAWTTRAPVVVEDGPNDPKLHPAFRHRLHVGSIIYLPLLRTDRKPMGTMSLIRHVPGTFTREQLELATVLAARAATAIEKAKLYASARRLASSQETLLRELNHRVKNNLASIVTLLQVNRPMMPEPAMRWLNRVTGRVATMARTHELFVGGAASVALGDLVSKLLPSLSVVKPTRAQVRTHLEAADTRLPTDRAVSLAMVLNELCWNALEHGVGEEGVLEIRARSGVDGRLIVEVEDDGGRQREAAAGNGGGGGDGGDTDGARAGTAGTDLMAVRRTRGMGLRLVEGLVARELGGRFVLLEAQGGGTLARVDLTILDEGPADDGAVGTDGAGQRVGP